jgi:hypothetical protein
MDYRQYLQSEHWQNLRGAKLQLNPRCECCRTKSELEVHHTFYRPSWFDTKIADLKTLCHDCHIEEHSKEWKRNPEVPDFARRDKAQEIAVEQARIEAIRIQRRKAQEKAALQQQKRFDRPIPRALRMRKIRHEFESNPIPARIATQLMPSELR